MLELIALLLEQPRVVVSRDALMEQLQRAGKVLITDAALIETRSGLQIWAQRFNMDDRLYLPRLALAAVRLVREE